MRIKSPADFVHGSSLRIRGPSGSKPLRR
jgi:hypothetical protein